MRWRLQRRQADRGAGRLHGSPIRGRIRREGLVSQVRQRRGRLDFRRPLIGSTGRVALVVPVISIMLIVPAVARATSGSIAFLRAGNIWLAAPDGSAAHQLTTDGGYQFVSAAKGSGSPLLGFEQLTSSGVSTYGVISAAGGSPQQVATSIQPREPYADAELDAAGDKLVYSGRCTTRRSRGTTASPTRLPM